LNSGNLHSTLINLYGMKLKKNIAVSENGFLFDPNTGESFSLNKTGKLIVKLLSERKSEEEIMEALLLSYDIDEHALQRYFDEFALMLRQYNLIVPEEN
jgi:hypothetical protein